jgi:hypothetical protein
MVRQSLEDSLLTVFRLFGYLHLISKFANLLIVSKPGTGAELVMRGKSREAICMSARACPTTGPREIAGRKHPDYVPPSALGG